MKKLFGLGLLLSSFTFATSIETHLSCQGMTEEGKKIRVETFKNDTLELSIFSAQEKKPAFYETQVLDISSAETNSYALVIEAKKDHRPVDGPLMVAKLTVQLESLIPFQNGNPSQLKLMTMGRMGKTVKNYSLTCHFN